MTDDDAAMQAKIAALAGQINRHKQQQSEPFAPNAHLHQAHNHASQTPHRSTYQATNHRWAPFPSPRARGRGGYGHTFQNRTLVNTPQSSSSNETPSPQPQQSQQPAPQQQIPEQQQEQRQQQQQQQQTPQEHQISRDQQSQTKPARHPYTPNVTRELMIEGIRFSMKEDGSKLIRLSETSQQTPKKAVVAGVEFLRTKSGNLLRVVPTTMTSKLSKRPVAACQYFTQNGVCRFGDNCRFEHDPEKVAMCKTFFRTGSCIKGDLCDLSHKPTYNRVPACAHFLNGNCKNTACRFAHVSVSPGPLICRPFALLGYCDAGTKCGKRHIYECPDFAENGECPNQSCKLPHLRHANVERRKARQGDESELEDEDEIQETPDAKDIDSDEYDVEIMTGDGPGFAQNDDYVAFD